MQHHSPSQSKALKQTGPKASSPGFGPSIVNEEAAELSCGGPCGSALTGYNIPNKRQAWQHSISLLRSLHEEKISTGLV